MKLAAIDIGSNGARLLISNVLKPSKALNNLEQAPQALQVVFKDVEYVRFALRLGKDVFKKQRIGKKKQSQLLKLMQSYKLLMELHEVDDYMALATSAFREASNGKEIALWIKQETGINIEIIEGVREAEILNYVIIKQLDKNKNYLHIDVGGGSTEINLYRNKQKLISRSFPLGSIREVEDSMVAMQDMKTWIEKSRKRYFGEQEEIIALGTGGNINKLQNMLNKEDDTLLSQMDMVRALEYLNNFSYDDMINVLELNPDRADTIIPAIKLYIAAMQYAKTDHIIVPKLGLKDGMMEVMYARRKDTKKELILV